MGHLVGRTSGVALLARRQSVSRLLLLLSFVNRVDGRLSRMDLVDRLDRRLPRVMRVLGSVSRVLTVHRALPRVTPS